MRRPPAHLPQTHCHPQPRRHTCRGAVLALTIASCLFRLTEPLTAADDFDAYRQSVRPLLDAHCIACHGSIRQSAGLRLDHGAAMLKGADSGPVVIPRNPADSSLVHKVRSTDPQSQMPPAGEGEHLSEQQITVLTDWIAAGALFPPDEAIPASPSEWWSVQPVKRPAPPAIDNPWVRNPVDTFIAAAHTQHQLSPAREASPPVLLRRLYLDLIGIPPTATELNAWLNDASPDRFERKVDELLARPEYGQRWGRHWMDVWRYSDWYGSRAINEIRYSQRHIWRWRDWIVDSLNTDKPYDRMITEMLAADEIAADDATALAATGFLGRNWYKFDRNVWMFETVEQTAQAFLAITLRCARCHDHKYDPLSQTEYYQFRAFFEPHDVRIDPLSANVTTEKDATLGDVLKEGVSRIYDRELDVPTFVFQRGDNRYPDKDRPVSPAVPAFLGGSVNIQPVQLPAAASDPHLRPAVLNGLIANADRTISEAQTALQQAHSKQQTADLAVTERQQQLATQNPDQPARQTASEPPVPPIFADDFHTRSPHWKVVSGDWTWQDGVLQLPTVASFATVVAEPVLPRNCRIKVRYRTLQPGSYRSVGFSFDYLDTGNSQDVYTATGDASQTIQAFHRNAGQQHYPAAGIVQTPLQVGQEICVEAVIREQQLTLLLDGQKKLEYTMPLARREGRLALWVHQGSAQFLQVEVQPLISTLADLQVAAAQAATGVKVATAGLAAAEAERESLSCRIAAELARCGLSTEPHQPLAEKAARAEKLAAIARTRSTLAATTDSAKVQELEATITKLQQEADSQGTQYSPLGPTFPRSSSGRRLALARWIASPQNPRTARVAVNQIWLRHFGEALVPSVANFGMNGARPTHPQLLDWLAAELIHNGWQMKSVHRLIVCSATWRQASTNPHTTTTDPANRWLTRMPPRRMEAEIVRDSLLHAAGLLDLQPGGPELPESDIQTIYRRSLYFRNTPNEKAGLLETFDAPNPNECYRRQTSVVPQQALALLNSGLAIDASRQLAEKLMTVAQTSNVEHHNLKFVRLAFETILSRSPTEQEMTACLQFLQDLPTQLQQSDLPVFPAGTGTAQRSPAADPMQRARENLLLVLFSHNDFVTIR